MQILNINGLVAQARSMEIANLIGQAELLENLFCAKSTFEEVPLPKPSWREITQKCVSGVAQLQKEILEEHTVRLRKAVETASPVALGALDGMCWKDSVDEEAPSLQGLSSACPAAGSRVGTILASATKILSVLEPQSGKCRITSPGCRVLATEEPQRN